MAWSLKLARPSNCVTRGLQPFSRKNSQPRLLLYHPISQAQVLPQQVLYPPVWVCLKRKGVLVNPPVDHHFPKRIGIFLIELAFWETKIPSFFSSIPSMLCGPDRSLSERHGSLSSSQTRRTSSRALKGISNWSSDMAWLWGHDNAYRYT